LEEACEVLRAAEREGWAVVPAGACAWLDAGRPPRRADVILKTTRMTRLVEHEPADLVATAEAGMTFADFNGRAGRAGQWLPLDPPRADAATLGGVVATGACGPQSAGYGLPRSYVLGMKVALAGGRLIRAGGRVVKNVAGYDLCKLFTGSHGTLGVVLEVTFKLRPRPRREATLVARSADWGELAGAARALASSQLLPVAVELLSPRAAEGVGLTALGEAGASLFVAARFAGAGATVEHQLARAAELLCEHAKRADVSRLDDDDEVWSGLSRQHAAGAAAGLVWRASVPPTALGALLALLPETYGDAGALSWHAGAADGRLRVFEPEAAAGAGARGLDAAARLGRLREAARRSGGSLVVERSAPELRESFDAWGLSESAALLMGRVKSRLDPRDTFSPGRYEFGPAGST
jgi:FAD/FMN-containing dehydrogenase